MKDSFDRADSINVDYATDPEAWIFRTLQYSQI
ncbi:hypothetical protein A2U01_0112656 [Trifolium medium]|uniref:Uncharacterized protein n=1 Tax=Trifolium medium TaxID=97028 RepID=A0A392VV78_9FABA|nr:hypothetical protein [Trifolium medium]